MVTGIATKYAGIVFRSRLEARWAITFDSLGWPWKYEPIDLAGYISDFVLGFERPLLVEVKPYVTLEQWPEAQGKIERSGWDGEAIILDAAPLVGAAQPAVGRMAERDGGGWQWDTARVFRCLACEQPSVMSEAGSWRCRRSGCAPAGGNSHMGPMRELEAIWNKAGNSSAPAPASR